MELQEFKMHDYGNTCAETGEWIAPGATCYAPNWDVVRAGGAICETAYKGRSKSVGKREKSDAPAEVTPPDTEV